MPLSKFVSFPVFLLLAFILAGSPANSSEPWVDWQNPVVIENDIIGKIWSVRENQFVSPSDMITSLAAAKYVLAGEVHDNRDHHLLQAWIIDQIVQAAKGAKPAIIMEMIRADKSGDLAKYMNDPSANSTGLAAVLEWEKSGWPQWSFYQPIADVIFKNNLRLFAGDPERRRVRGVSKNGFAGFGDEDIRKLAIGTPLQAPLARALNADIVLSHCNLLPATMIAPMVKVQRFRDASLARAMKDAAKETGRGVKAILIAGNGHVRSDRAVPWYIGHQDKAASAMSVLMVETDSIDDKLEDLLVRDPQGAPAGDYFWFTPGVEREDQCEKLRKRFKKRD